VGKLSPVNEKQYALAAEIRAEMAAQRITATEMQRRTGIKHASWRNYFVTASRPAPFPEIDAVCAELGVPTSEMIRRGEARLGQSAPSTVDPRLAGMMSPETRALVEEQIARSRAERGGEVPEDPPEATTKGRRSA
jgi:hypothetical protein